MQQLIDAFTKEGVGAGLGGKIALQEVGVALGVEGQGDQLRSVGQVLRHAQVGAAQRLALGRVADEGCRLPMRALGGLGLVNLGVLGLHLHQLSLQYIISALDWMYNSTPKHPLSQFPHPYILTLFPHSNTLRCHSRAPPPSPLPPQLHLNLLQTLLAAQEPGLSASTLHQLRTCLVQHTDQHQNTSTSAKLFYLSLRALQARLAVSNSPQHKQLVLQYLGEAASLFHSELLAAPVPAYQHEQPSKRNIKHIAESFRRSMGGQGSEQLGKQLRDSHVELSRNKYGYLLTLLVGYELEGLLGNLQYILARVDKTHSTASSQHPELQTKLTLTLQLLLRRIYLQHLLADPHHSLLNTNPHKNAPIMSVFQPSASHSQLLTVLKYICGVLLGNIHIIATYAGANVYLYLRLCLLYRQDSASLWGQNWQQYITRYLMEKYPTFSGGQQQPELLPSHRYLLRAIKVQSYHGLHQLGLRVMDGFMARLLCTLYYRAGVVERELQVLDQDYLGEQLGEMVVAVIGEVAGEMTEGREVGQIKKMSSLFNYFTDKEQYDENYQFYDAQQEQPQDSSNPWIDTPRCQLFLATLAYCKHLHHCQLSQQHRLRSLLDPEPVPDPPLPQHQLALNLLPRVLPLALLCDYSQLSKLEALAKYSCQVEIAEYFQQYLRHMVRLHMREGSLLNGLKLVDRHGLELMVLEVKLSVWAKGQYTDTETMNMLAGGYLTECTLEAGFEYGLLGRVRELGTGSEPDEAEALEQFKTYFQIFMQLQPLGTPTPSQPLLPLLLSLSHHLHSLTTLLHKYPLQACGQVLRLAHSLLQLYQQTKLQLQQQKCTTLRPEEEEQVELMSDAMIEMVGVLRGYMEGMAEAGWETEVWRKFRAVLF